MLIGFSVPHMTSDALKCANRGQPYAVMLRALGDRVINVEFCGKKARFAEIKKAALTK